MSAAAILRVLSRNRTAEVVVAPAPPPEGALITPEGNVVTTPEGDTIVPENP